MYTILTSFLHTIRFVVVFSLYSIFTYLFMFDSPVALVDLFLKLLNYESRMRESSKQKNNIVCPL